MARSFVGPLLAAGMLALAGCGGGASAPPVASAPGLPGAPAAAVPPGSVAAQAVRGVLVSVNLPLRNSDDLDSLIANQSDRSSPLYHHFLTPGQFKTQYAPPDADVAAADADLRAAGFKTTVTTQGVLAVADQATVERAFQVRLRAPLSARSTQSVSSAPALLVPSSAPQLDPVLTRVGASLGFAATHFHVDSKRVGSAAFTDNRYGTDGPYWFTDLKQAYQYPSYNEADGAGRTIAIVISSDILDSDLAGYFAHEKLTSVAPVERRPVLGGAPFGGVNSSDSDEASLDTQQSLGSAPGAHVLLYDIPDLSDQSIFAAYTAIVEDGRADIVSSSFGGCELYYTKAYNSGLDYTSILQQFHNVYRQGNAEGITFVASSGDNGAYECYDPTGSQKILGGASSPASDPNVTAVGGTNLQTTYVAGSRHSAYVSENADDDPLDPAQGNAPNDVWGSGGGISQVFKKPLYQAIVNTGSAYRTVPDVAMHMGGCPYGTLDNCLALPRSSVVTEIAGGYYLLIGTSASAPEFAGLLAVIEGHLGTRLGNVNPYLYALAAVGGSQFYHTNIPGNNGYPTKPGYNLVVGNGTPRAAALALYPFGALAGDPWTPSNP